MTDNNVSKLPAIAPMSKLLFPINKNQIHSE